MKDLEPKYELMPCDESDTDYMYQKLGEYDDSVVPPRVDAPDERIVLKITDGEGNLIAGCTAGLCTWDVADLGLLWVDERYRRQRLASVLLREAERISREKGCYLMVLETADFQARPFYEKHGYTLCGTVEDFPKGHNWNYLMKRLDQPSAEYISSRQEMEITVRIEHGNDEDADFIRGKLVEYNANFATYGDDYDWSKKLTDENGELIAVCSGDVSWWGSGAYFSVCGIWVEEAFRGKGIGSYLLREFELEAKEKGAFMAMAQVFDWQFDFLKKNGYKVCALTPDFPKGHSRYMMQKTL